MFINFSNHPSAKWQAEQINAAEKYGKITDIPFPNVSPLAEENDITEMAEKLVDEIMAKSPDAVMCQGEFSLAYAVISRLLNKGVTVLTACSERKTEEKKLDNGEVEKNTFFKFVKFRKYL